MTCDDYKDLVLNKDPLEATNAEIAAYLTHKMSCKACRTWQDSLGKASDDPEYCKQVFQKAAEFNRQRRIDPEIQIPDGLR